jgi:hypothetical protein
MTITEFKEHYNINIYLYDRHPNKYEFYAFIVKKDDLSIIVHRDNEYLDKKIISQIAETNEQLKEKYMRVLANNCLLELGVIGYDSMNPKNNIYELYENSI